MRQILSQSFPSLNQNKKLALLVWLGIIAVLMGVWRLIPSPVWQYLFLLRVPLLIGLLLIALPFLSIFLLRAMLKNLFVLRGTSQLTFVIISAVMAGLAAVLIGSTILANIPARFGLPLCQVTPSPSWLYGWQCFWRGNWVPLSESWQYSSAIALSLPTVIAAAYLSTKEKELPLKKTLKAIFLGGGSSIDLLFAINFTRHWLNNQVWLKEIVIKIVKVATLQRSQGYIEQGELTQGHLTSLAFLIVGLVVYGVIFLLFQPTPTPSEVELTKSQKGFFSHWYLQLIILIANIRQRKEAPALLYLMLIFWLITLLFGGLTFYFDYFRIPVLLSFLLLSALSYLVFGVDHFYQLNPKSNSDRGTKFDSSNFQVALQERLKYQSGEEGKNLVIICSSGGGIQAAGWTVQVLTGLQDLLGPEFTQAIGLLSSVSGGSVGTMYYLDRFGTQGFPEQNELEAIFQSATQDSLDAVGWGLAYPDLWRIIGLPFLAPRMLDRGITLERDWQQEMEKAKKTTSLTTWRKRILAGEIPIPIFNSTLVEDGRRFLLTPMSFGESAAKEYVDFNSLYGKDNYDMNVVTAARLSATFPYVSPICRNNYDLEENYHVADGGYFDNSGFVTVLEWLNEWLGNFQDLNIKKVFLLQINAFPESPSKETVEADGGWFMSTIGPLLTLYKVRDTILASRNATEVEILRQRWEDQVKIEYFPIFFPSFTERESSSSSPKTSFYNEEGRYEPPLSWKLTKREKEEIKQAWDKIKNQDIIQNLQTKWQNSRNNKND